MSYQTDLLVVVVPFRQRSVHFREYGSVRQCRGSSRKVSLDLGRGALFHRLAHPVPTAGDGCGDAVVLVLLPQNGGRLLRRQWRVDDRSLFG